MTNPPQHPQQPPYPPQPPYGHQPPYGVGPGAVPPPAAPGRGNPMGLIALIAGAVLLVLQFAGVFVQAAIIRGSDYTAIQMLNVGQGIVQGIFGLIAVVFGIIGIVQKGRSPVFAAIGLGIGVTTLLGIVTGWLIFPLVTAL